MSQIERIASFRFSERGWLVCITLTGGPFIALFFRRLHDISPSKSTDAEICFALSAAMLDFYLETSLWIVRIIFLLYFFPKLFMRSVSGANDYGQEPVNELTTLPQSSTNQFHLFSKIQKFIGFIFFGLGLLVWTTQIKEVADYLADRNFSAKLKESLALKENIEISSLLDVDYRDADVLLLSPYMRLRHIECQGYSEGLLKRLTEQAPMNDGYHKIVVFNTFGILSSVELSARFCEEKVPVRKQACLKFQNAYFSRSKEADLNQNMHTCYALIEKGN
jgi:hypothetical protein